MNNLSAELLAAQDNISRYPLVEIKAGQFAADLPLIGKRIDAETLDQANSAAVTLASGRLVVAYTQDYTNGASIYPANTVRLAYTDTGRTEFTYIQLFKGTANADKISNLSICEMADGKLALLYVYYTSSTAKYTLKCTTFAYDGTLLSHNTIIAAQSLPITSASLARTASKYIASFLQDIVITASSVGTYTGTTDSRYNILVLSDGTQATAMFKWQKDAGAWSAPVTMTGSNQLLSDGVSVKFSAGEYWSGQEYWFDVVAAKKATAFIIIDNQPDDGDTLTVGATTYTFKTALTSPAIANEIKIDTLGMEITAENLRCAITAGSYEGTGEGVRYGAGTVANASATATREAKRVNLTAITTGISGNGIVLTVPVEHFEKTPFSGGVNTALGALQWVPSNKMYITSATSPSATWSAAAVPAIAGIVTTRKKADVCLFKQDDGTLWLFFTYATAGATEQTLVYNLLYAKSSDSGATWSAATTLTAFTTSSEVARRPAVLQKLATEIIVAYDSVKMSLTKDKKDAYWVNGSIQAIKYQHFNPANRKLYIACGDTGYGTKQLDGVMRIDIDSWTIDRYWSANTVPSIPLVFRSEHVIKFCGSGDTVIFCTENGLNGAMQLGILDGAASDLRQICFKDSATYGLKANVEAVPWQTALSQKFDTIHSMALDADTNTLYFSFFFAGNTTTVRAFTMDLTPAEVYAMTLFCSFTASIFSTPNESGNDSWLQLDKENGYLIMGTLGTAGSDRTGRLRLFLLNGGGLYKTFGYSAEQPNFPYCGARRAAVIGNTLFCSPNEYTTIHEQGNLWGLFSVNIASGRVTWYYPSSIITGGAQEIEAKDILATPEGIIIISTNKGVGMYDTLADIWALINNDTTPGVFPADYTAYNMWLSYDEASQLVFGGVRDSGNGFTGMIAFPLSGKIEQTQYFDVQYSGGVWNFGTSAALVQGTRDYDAALALDTATGGLYAFWTRWNSLENQQLIWAKETGVFDLTGKLIASQAITQTRTVDGTPGTLVFAVQDGHLFDTHNRASLLSSYLKKGKKILLRWGEKIGGANYWQEGAAVYAVTGLKLTYKRDQYPTLTVNCEDIKSLWDDTGITASTYYAGATPDAVLANLLTTFGDVEQTEQDLTALADEMPVYYQWLDTDLKAAIDNIMDRYGYFMDVSLADNKVRARKIGNNTVDHLYTSAANLVDFTPDDSYSSFINRVTVKGESREDIEIQTAEESLGGESGTLGFFQCEQTHRIYYSDDHEARASSPRLQITQDTSSIGFMMAGKMKTYISAVDLEGHYVDVTSKAPNLLPVFLGGLALFISGKGMPPVVTPYGVAESKAGSYMKDAGLWIMLQCLAAVGNYAFEIYGCPIGQVRKTFQASANDTVLQNELNGHIIETVIDDALCYEVEHAKDVADQELFIVKAQRNRVKFKKTPHLADDAGDTLQIPHPYTGQPLKIFVTNLARSMTIGSAYTDTLEGWVIEE